MRYVPILLATLTLTSVNACAGPTEAEGPTIRVQGTVTAADDGAPVVGAVLEVWRFCLADCRPAAWVITDDSGDYSLSFLRRDSCSVSPGHMTVSHPDFSHEVIGAVADDLYITCTEELQTIDVQLERRVL
jgi:hypothetical protein